MEDILKLIEIKRQKSLRSIQLLNQNFRKKEISKDNLLYEHVIENNLKSDEEAAYKVFKTDPNNRNYRNAKSKLRQKLFNHLYFLDYDKKGYTHYEKYQYEAMQELHQARVLMHEGATDLAVKKLLHLLKLAKICEETDIVCQSLIWLREIYAKQGKLSLYNEVGLAANYYFNFQQAIRSSEELYFKELVLINKSFSAQIRALNEIPISIKLIRGHSNEFNSTRIEILALRLELLYYRISNNFKKLVEICREIEDNYFHRKDEEIRVDLGENDLYLTRISAYFNLSKFEKGLAFSKEKESGFVPGVGPWFELFELRFLLAMHSGNFDEAAQCLRMVKASKEFRNISKLDQERWRIYRGFLIYFNNDKLVRWGFNLSDFLSYSPNYPKDHSGYSIAVLAIRFLYFLREGEFQNLEPALNELGKYSSSHLDKRSNYRTSVFIRMIKLVPENEFNAETIKEKGEVYFKKLKKTRVPQDPYSDLEVYPYDKMWEEILRILEKDKRYVHYKFYHFSES